MEFRIILAIAAGVLAFSLNAIFDWISIDKTFTKFKPFNAILFFCLQGFALYLGVWTANRFSLPLGLSVLGWILLPISSILLFYAIAIGIPWGGILFGRNVSDRLIKTGNYALVRHPDLIWYVTFLIALILVSRSITLVIVAPIWAVSKLICVVVQDKLLFDRMLPGYQQYKQETPMIIPNRKSIKACIGILK